MQSIPESELIINKRGAIYHLDLRPEELAPTVITVGDPDRVNRVSRHFDIVRARVGARHPEICAAAREGQMEHQGSAWSVMPLVHSGSGVRAIGNQPQPGGTAAAFGTDA